MGNMSYCRFANTLRDLQDCYENIDDDIEEDDDENGARVRLISLCKKIAKNYDDVETT